MYTRSPNKIPALKIFARGWVAQESIFFTLSTLRFSRGWVRKDGNLVTETGCMEAFVSTLPQLQSHTVGFNNFNLRIFNLRVSNPNKLIVDVFLTRCRISMSQGLGPKKHDEISEIDRKLFSGGGGVQHLSSRGSPSSMSCKGNLLCWLRVGWLNQVYVYYIIVFLSCSSMRLSICRSFGSHKNKSTCT